MRIIKLHLFVSEFGAKAFCSLVESRVKTKELKPFSTFAVEGVINSNILERVTNFSFRNKQVNFKILTFCFLMTFFFFSAHTSQLIWNSHWIQHCSYKWRCYPLKWKRFFFNWDSLHARLNSHYEAWSYKKKKYKKIKTYRESV